MSIFKRIEVWVLLVLTVAGLVFVLLSRNGQEIDEFGARPSRIGHKKFNQMQEASSDSMQSKALQHT